MRLIHVSKVKVVAFGLFYVKKHFFKREESNHLICRNQKIFNDINFRVDLENKHEECPKHYKNFIKAFANVLDPRAPR